VTLIVFDLKWLLKGEILAVWDPTVATGSSEINNVFIL